jgi:PhnB protein
MFMCSPPPLISLLARRDMKIHPYLNFDGKTEEAFNFYAKVLGGELTEIHRFGSMPPQSGFELNDEQKNRVMHVGLQLPDGQLLMASDTLPGMGPDPAQGNTFHISVHPDSRSDADRIFNALGEGGTVTMPIADQFWGDYYGSVTDRFGVNWMVNYSAIA